MLVNGNFCFGEGMVAKVKWPKGHKVVSDYFAKVLEGETARVIVMESNLDPRLKGGVHGVLYGGNRRTITIIIDRHLPADRKSQIIEEELAHLRNGGRVLPRKAVDEPRRVCRRLQLLREWSHDKRIKEPEVLAGGA
jgi:hypothetical protein